MKDNNNIYDNLSEEEKLSLSEKIYKKRQDIYTRVERGEKVNLKDFAYWMRLNPTYAEKCVNKILKSFKIRFCRQFVIEPFIVDFIFRKYKLIIEVDGPVHEDRQKEDKKRDDFLKSKGYYVKHIDAYEAYNIPELVYYDVKDYLEFLKDKKDKGHL